MENGIDSPYLDWFHFDEERLQAKNQPDACAGRKRRINFGRREHTLRELGYRAWFQLPALPKLSTETGAVRRFISGVASQWIEFGIDGWCLEVPGDIDDDVFWREFRRIVKNGNQETYVVGEIWDDAARWLQGNQFHTVMNYVFNRACLGFFGDQMLDTSRRPGGYHLRPLRATEIADQIDDLLDLHPWQATLAQLNLLGSHHVPRFLTLVQEDKQALKLATLFQMTFPGAHSIYYGDEIGMEGGPDPDCRRAFPWDDSR